MGTLMIIIFIVGYLAIATEHSIHVDKAASALVTGVLIWTIYVLNADALLAGLDTFMEWMPHEGEKTPLHFVEHELHYHLGHIAEILFFLMGAMTIVELVDAHEGFAVVTDRIKTTKKVPLLWIIALLTFFFSAALDNLTTSIVMVSLLRKLIADKKDRWFFAGIVIIAANAGGAWSPIGDVTTTMLWIDGQITTVSVVTNLILPSLICILVPLAVLTFTLKGTVMRPEEDNSHVRLATSSERNIIFFLGVALLLFVPIFKSTTHLPPYMGMLLSLGILWIVTEVMHRKKPRSVRTQLNVMHVLQKIDTASVLFFLGILIAIHGLQSVGHLAGLADFLQDNLGDMYVINIAIGLMSALVDNVPLVAAAMGMYDITPAAMENMSAWDALFVQDGNFWLFLAYCAGTGGSALIIGSAAGVAVMGMEKIDFFWYLKKMSLLAILGYFAGAGAYILQYSLLH